MYQWLGWSLPLTFMYLPFEATQVISQVLVGQVCLHLILDVAECPLDVIPPCFIYSWNPFPFPFSNVGMPPFYVYCSFSSYCGLCKIFSLLHTSLFLTWQLDFALASYLIFALFMKPSLVHALGEHHFLPNWRLWIWQNLCVFLLWLILLPLFHLAKELCPLPCWLLTILLGFRERFLPSSSLPCLTQPPNLLCLHQPVS